MKIVHVGMFHRTDDIRIYVKECMSLAQENYSVTYITSKTDGADIINNCVKIVELPITRHSASRLSHPIQAVKSKEKKQRLLLDAIANENPNVIHIHEYELLRPVLMYTKKTNIKVIYDIHEDLPRLLNDKYVNENFIVRNIKRIENAFIEVSENRKSKKCNALITATPAIYERFKLKSSNCVCIPNYPIIDFSSSIFPKRNGHLCYVGMITEQRGIVQLVKAMAGTNVKLDLVGDINRDLQIALEKTEGWENVNWYGYKKRDEAEKIRNSASIGVVTFLPAGNHTRSLPNKIFEYMASGLPVIVSDFPEWKEIVESNGCGICVNPYSVEEIRNAVQFLTNHKDVAKHMGELGFQAVRNNYNWDVCHRRLLCLYREVLINESSN